MQISVLKIDVFTESIYPITIRADSLSDLYEAIGCQTIDFVARQPNGDALCVDDEALLTDEKAPCFRLLGYPSPICGNALVIGADRQGHSRSPKTSVDEIRRRVQFTGFLDIEPQLTFISF